MPNENIKRLAYIDVARGIGIVLVVAAHAEGLHPLIFKWISSLVMPLFFFVSGYVVSQRSLEGKFTDYLKTNFRSIVIPYFFFGIITYIPWLLVFRNYETVAYVENEGLKQFIGLFYGIGRDWLRYNVPLWFLPCFFTTKIIFFWLIRLKKTSLIILFLILSSIGGHVLVKYLPFSLPWLVEVSMIMVVFFAAGYFSKGKFPEFSGVKSLSIGLVCLAVNIVLMSINEVRVDINYGVVGNIFLFCTSAIPGILSIVYLSMFLHASSNMEKMFSVLGRESLVIFALNAVTYKLITGVAIYILKLPADFRTLYPISVPIYIIITCVGLVFVGKFLSKYLPWSVGGRK
jgi:fucose 4-O-acetylase-like acetyltransferase